MREGALSSETACSPGAPHAGLREARTGDTENPKTVFICVLSELNSTSEKVVQLWGKDTILPPVIRECVKL